jgi:glycosyltransferase involved in cell wall biosynthesis
LRRVRILRVITRLNIGGPSIQAITLSARLARRGYETLLVHGSLGHAEGDMSYLLPDGVRTRPVPALRREIAPLSDARALAELVRIAREWRPDIVHTHMAKAGSAGRAAAAIANATRGRGQRARVVHTYHGHVLEGYFGPGKTRAFIAVERALARVTDRLIAISPQIARELLELHRIGRAGQYRVVPLGFDLAPFTAVNDRSRQAGRTALALAPDAHVVTTVGRLTAIKQHDLFLEVARLVSAADPRAVFLIAGDGELRRQLEERARADGLADRIRFLGWRRDLDVVYGATDVFLLTSANEGTPVALIESLAAGVPGVSTDVGGVRDVIETERTGRLARPGDAAALADHVTALLADADLRRRIGEAGRASVLARYGIDRLVDDVDRLYRELMNRDHVS